MSKEEKYNLLVKQVECLVEGCDDSVSLMANVSAAIHETMGFFWTGFYVEKDNMLKLGPFQGSVACYTIPHGKGVCGTSYERKQTIVVPDVEQFPGHIACSSLSRSEIVVPVFDDMGNVKAVLDIDSKELSTFDATDAHYLEIIAKTISRHL
jgi:GAF domain-containing protein